MRPSGLRSFHLQAAFALAAASLGALSMVRADWIEQLFGFDPDGHSGAAEIAVFACAVAFAALATRNYRKLAQGA
jgi:hypothetical protein